MTTAEHIELPKGLHAPRPAMPLSALELETLAELVDVGNAGLRGDTAGRPGTVRPGIAALTRRGLARPTSRPAHYTLALSWNSGEARRMLTAVPGSLVGWEPSWWAPGELSALASVIAPVVGDELAPWVAAAVAGVEVAPPEKR